MLTSCSKGLVTGSRDEFEQSWEVLSKALREIHEKNASSLSFEQLYRASYKIVLRKQGDRLYDLVKEYEEQWFAGNVMPSINKLITTNLINITLSGVASSTANERRVTGEAFLNGLKATWEDHINVMSMTTDILMYMDRIYCTDNRKASIFTTAMGLFRDHILRKPQLDTDNVTIFDILNSVVLDMVDMERDGDVINKATVRSCMYMLEGLYETDNEEGSEKLYLTTFEPAFLNASRAFYQKECATLLREADASSWLRQTNKRFLEEAARCQTTIMQSSAKPIAKVVEQELISAHLQEFLALDGTGIKAMIQHDRLEDIRILYQLISRVDPTKEPLKLALQARVVDMGNEINQTILNTDWSAAPPVEESGNAETGAGSAKKAPKQTAQAKATMAAIKWVDEVLKLKDKFDNLWTKCLNSDLQLQTALNKSFATFIDAFQRSSEYVSLFIDDNLKRGIMGKTEAEVDDVLDKATTLLRFITDKDLFERYYKKHLARRLLHGKSQSADVEKQMISRMKQEIGNAFTTKLDGMFKDMSMSDELTSGYRDYVKNLGDADRSVPELGVSVLTTNCWPMESMGGAASRDENAPQTCLWPAHISTLQESFKKYYLKERNGRKLTWLGYLGNADVKCVFPKVAGKEGTLGRERRYELSVSTYGMLILMLFNDLREGVSLSLEEIQSQTQIPLAELIRNLTSLAVLPKSKVLNKSPPTKEVKSGDTFTFNNIFFSKAIKIKVPVIAGAINKVEGEEERKDTEDRNDEHRGNIIDTVLVRVMKYVLLNVSLSCSLLIGLQGSQRTYASTPRLRNDCPTCESLQA